MVSINTEISKALAKLHIKSSHVSSNIVFTAKFKYSIMMLKNLLSILELHITIDIISYTSCKSFPCIAQSICTAEIKILYKCVDMIAA